MSYLCNREFKVPMTDRLLHVRICQPVPTLTGEWTCKAQIDSDETKHEIDTFGYDSFQVVCLAGEAAGAKLLELAPNAEWQGMPIQIAFPKAVPSFLGIDFYNKISTLIEGEIEQFNKKYE